MILTTETMMDESDEIPNPFSLHALGLGGRSLRPLQPWSNEEHAAYYLPVDNTQAGFDTFVRQLPDPVANLTAHRQLVVVAGPTGCGRTSLIHRCVHHLSRHFNGEIGGRESTYAVADLSTREVFDVAGARRAEINDHLDQMAHLVRLELSAKTKAVADPKETVLPANVAYARLAKELAAEKVIAVIVLPRFVDSTRRRSISMIRELHPVHRYLSFANPRMIFFAESENPTQIRSWHERLGGTESEDTLIIEVDRLSGQDGWIFANGRIDKCRDPRVPKVSPETMNAVMQDHNRMSLNQLQRMCFHLWEEARTRPGVEEVGKQDFERYYDQRRGAYRQRDRGRKNGQP